MGASSCRRWADSDEASTCDCCVNRKRSGGTELDRCDGWVLGVCPSMTRHSHTDCSRFLHIRGSYTSSAVHYGMEWGGYSWREAMYCDTTVSALDFRTIQCSDFTRYNTSCSRLTVCRDSRNAIALHVLVACTRTSWQIYFSLLLHSNVTYHTHVLT